MGRCCCKEQRKGVRSTVYVSVLLQAFQVFIGPNGVIEDVRTYVGFSDDEVFAGASGERARLTHGRSDTNQLKQKAHE